MLKKNKKTPHPCLYTFILAILFELKKLLVSSIMEACDKTLGKFYDMLIKTVIPDMQCKDHFTRQSSNRGKEVICGQWPREETESQLKALDSQSLDEIQKC